MLFVCWNMFCNISDSQSQAGAAEINCPPHHPQWKKKTQHAENKTHTLNTHSLLSTQNTLIGMRAIAGGSPFPLWYTERRAHSDSDTQAEYLVCNRIRRNLKAQKHSHGAYRHREGNTLRLSTIRAWVTTTTPTSSHTTLLLWICVCNLVSGLDNQYVSGWRDIGYIRWDWETILVRLRPRESTWLDTLLAVDKGCLVRTRPAGEWSGNHEYKEHTAVLLHLVTECAAEWSPATKKHYSWRKATNAGSCWTGLILN